MHWIIHQFIHPAPHQEADYWKRHCDWLGREFLPPIVATDTGGIYYESL